MLKGPSRRRAQHASSGVRKSDRLASPMGDLEGLPNFPEAVSSVIQGDTPGSQAYSEG